MNNLVIDIIYFLAESLVADISPHLSLISEGRTSNCGRFGLILDVFIPQFKCALTVVDMSASLTKELIAIISARVAGLPYQSRLISPAYRYSCSIQHVLYYI